MERFRKGWIGLGVKGIEKEERRKSVEGDEVIKFGELGFISSRLLIIISEGTANAWQRKDTRKVQKKAKTS